MQDPRIRIAAAAVLSLAAFLSLHGAAAAFLWWLVFTPRLLLTRSGWLCVDPRDSVPVWSWN
jgi:phage-related protein